MTEPNVRIEIVDYDPRRPALYEEERDLAARFHGNRRAYLQGKSDFVRSIESKARH